ncbi:single-stranded DNA-binding protein [Treponema pedis]|uniref:single-stranded DNA-binding protein n=1 Tax=Treponema pedis TaxID=409322 RepID=UPI003140CA9F
MTDLNKFTATGRLTGNAELRYTSNGTACTSFSIACNKSYKQDGEWLEKAHFFNCVIWGKYGEAMQKHLTRGKQIAIEAELNHKPWKDKNEALHNDIVLNVQNLILLSSPKSKNTNNKDNQFYDSALMEEPEEIPF